MSLRMVSHFVERSQQLIAHAIDRDHVPPAQALDDPTRWQNVLELIERAVRVETPQRHVEHDFGIEL